MQLARHTRLQGQFLHAFHRDPFSRSQQPFSIPRAIQNNAGAMWSRASAIILKLTTLMTDIHCLRHACLSYNFGFNRHSEYYAGLVTEPAYECLHIYSNSIYLCSCSYSHFKSQPAIWSSCPGCWPALLFWWIQTQTPLVSCWSSFIICGWFPLYHIVLRRVLLLYAWKFLPFLCHN